MANRESTSILVERARAGDREAFEAIARRFRPRLEEQIRSRMGGAAKAKLEPEDVLSETFTRALDSIERLEWRGAETFYRWLGSIAEHVIRHAVRKKGWGQLTLDVDVAASDASPSGRRIGLRGVRGVRVRVEEAGETPTSRGFQPLLGAQASRLHLAKKRLPKQ